MLSDIEIAKQAKMLKIGEVAAKLGISEDEYEPYGHYKAKLSESLYAKTKNDPDGKLILVTAINPTPAGEVQHNGNIGSTFVQHFFQCLSLRDSTGETIEDDAFGVHLAVQNLSQHVNDQFIRNQLSFFNVIFSNLTQLCLVLHFRTQNITCRDMIQTIFFNNQFALCSLS